MFIVGGVLVFQERLSRVQMVALVIAVAGVAYLTIRTGELVWVAPALAGTFAAYGLIRKWGNVPPTGGLLVETAALLLVAALLLGLASISKALVRNGNLVAIGPTVRCWWAWAL